MQRCNQKAYAKINLTLNVLGKLASGYHRIESVMQQVELCDEITIRKRDRGIIISSNDARIPKGRENIAHKAASLMKSKFNIQEGIEITIKKNIPVAAGLSGGSADAGAVLASINRLFNLNLSTNELAEAAAEIGMDVPFSILGGAAIARGRGEVLEKINSARMDVVLVNPGIEILTKEAYGMLDLRTCGRNIPTTKMIEAMKEENIERIAELLHNDFEASTIKRYPVIGKIKKELINNGALNALMSGSGATVFGIFRNKSKAKIAFENLKEKYPFTCLTRTR
jgi:4-diphosphocytidyl-2-C-methyl-D-erythritol kinase